MENTSVYTSRISDFQITVLQEKKFSSGKCTHTQLCNQYEVATLVTHLCKKMPIQTGFGLKRLLTIPSINSQLITTQINSQFYFGTQIQNEKFSITPSAIAVFLRLAMYKGYSLYNSQNCADSEACARTDRMILARARLMAVAPAVRMLKQAR